MRYLPILLAGALSACTSTTPHWDSRFGLDTRTALMQQVADPAAAHNTDPVAGMDGRAARAAYERYQKASGEAQQPALVSGAAK
ncbi:hypothetical protein SAMN05216320_108206 [Duganella sp. OV458]|nr:hypothetical protein SAMN05216320_108206 [Duganella sp. OV458]SDJ47531.1 hypothetical protein SAMN05428973_104241 [Duganella sp. OV510]